MNDSEAIALALNGREDGFKAIFANHSACLFTHALKFTGRRETAEDLVQETFSDAFRFLAGFRGQARLRTWLYKILFRKAIKKREATPAEFRFDSGKTEKGFAQSELKLDTSRILDLMAEKDRSILMLAYWDELKIEEIAEILEISPVNAKVSLFRARQKFARFWQQNCRQGDNSYEL
ncbi:MAG: RNA polymerase sigma factor [Candidatus Rifleibacteriota bacterium]